MNESEFARWIGASPSVVWKWLHESAVPSAKYLRIIMDKTGGRVMPNDFFDPPITMLPVRKRVAG